MSDLVGNPKDRFSRVAAHFIMKSLLSIINFLSFPTGRHMGTVEQCNQGLHYLPYVLCHEKTCLLGL